MSTRVVIVSHQHLLLSLLSERLVAHGMADAVSEFTTLADLEKNWSEQRQAGVFLVDADIPGVGASRLLNFGLKCSGARRAVLLTDSKGGFLAYKALQIGWQGILHKRDTWDGLQQGLRTIIGGGLYVSPLVDQSQRLLFARSLSDREIDVMEGIAAGRSMKAIAAQLRVTPATVRTHRRNCMRKVNAHTQLELALYALRQGVLPLM